MANEKDSALPVGREKRISVGMAIETDEALPVSPVKTVHDAARRLVTEYPGWKRATAVLGVTSLVPGFVFGFWGGVVGAVLGALGLLVGERAYR